MARYYEPNPTDKIKPGKLSAELREALDIPENDVPIWIYRMRALGYPPGWLKKAIVGNDDIFDSDERSSNKRSHDESEQDDVRYDHSKLIEYPGFNAPLPEGCNDYHYYVNMPGMLEHQQLEFAKKHMKTVDESPKRLKHENGSMERNGPTTSESIKKEVSVKEEAAVKEELAIKKEISIKVEDKDNEVDIKPIIIKKEKSDESEPTTNHKTEEHNQDNCRVEEQHNCDQAANVSLPNISTVNQEAKLVSRGSPMPRLSRTPLERFSEGVTTELLYFENITNSTGRFDNIRGLLNNMRKSL